MPCGRQFILEKIRFDKKKEKRLPKADETKKVSSAFFQSRDNQAKSGVVYPVRELYLSKNRVNPT